MWTYKRLLRHVPSSRIFLPLAANSPTISLVRDKGDMKQSACLLTGDASVGKLCEDGRGRNFEGFDLTIPCCEWARASKLLALSCSGFSLLFMEEYGRFLPFEWLTRKNVASKKTHAPNARARVSFVMVDQMDNLSIPHFTTSCWWDALSFEVIKKSFCVLHLKVIFRDLSAFQTFCWKAALYGMVAIDSDIMVVVMSWHFHSQYRVSSSSLQPFVKLNDKKTSRPKSWG